jgi:hypothetical protein
VRWQDCVMGYSWRKDLTSAGTQRQLLVLGLAVAFFGAFGALEYSDAKPIFESCQAS